MTETTTPRTPWNGATPTDPVVLRPLVKNGRFTWSAWVHYGQHPNR